MIYFIVAGDSDQPIRSIDQNELNMYLAAPELLSALKFALENLVQEYPESEWSYYPAIARAQAIIAKTKPDKEMEVMS